MTTRTEYRVGTVVKANVMIDSITVISVQLMRRENYQTAAEAAAWFSAVPLGPVGVYCVADKMVNVLEVLFEPELVVDTTEPPLPTTLVVFEFEDDSFYTWRRHLDGWQYLDPEGNTLDEPTLWHKIDLKEIVGLQCYSHVEDRP